MHRGHHRFGHHGKPYYGYLRYRRGYPYRYYGGYGGRYRYGVPYPHSNFYPTCGYGYRLPYRYGYRHFGYGYRSRWYTGPWYSDDRAEGAAESNEKQTELDDTGWKLLGKGQTAEALRVFSEQAPQYPQHGIPKVGYGLASAELGGLGWGVWAMRRAFRMDPESVHYVPVTEQLRPRIPALIERYKYMDSATGGAGDSIFMVGALYYLLDDLPAARSAAEQAIENGDRSPSAANLRQLASVGMVETRTQNVGTDGSVHGKPRGGGQNDGGSTDS